MKDLLRKRIVMMVLLFSMALLLMYIPFSLTSLLSLQYSRIGLFKWLSFWGLVWGMLSAVILVMSDVLGFRVPASTKRYTARIAFSLVSAGFGLQLVALLLS